MGLTDTVTTGELFLKKATKIEQCCRQNIEIIVEVGGNMCLTVQNISII